LQLTKAKEPEQALAVLDTALLFDSQNKSLKYTKGVVYEANRQADSAYYYQKFYEPSSWNIALSNGIYRAYEA